VWKKDLQTRMICSMFVAYSVMGLNKEHRVACCRRFMAFVDQERILPGGKTVRKIACQDYLFLSIMSELSTASLFRKAPQ
jgi:hypothetical protein